MDPKQTTCAEWLNKHQQVRKPLCVRWFSGKYYVESTLDIWTPRCSNPCLEWVNDLTNHLSKHDFIWPWKSLNKLDFIAYTVHAHWCHDIVPWSTWSRGRPGRCNPSLTANQLYMSFASKQRATSHFWNLYCKAASLLKPYLTYCLAADPSYFPLQKNPQDVM